MHVLEAGEGNAADIDPRARLHLVGQIDGVPVIVGDGDRRLHCRQRIAVFLERCQKLFPRIQHRVGDDGVTAFHIQGGAVGIRHGAVDRHLADMEQRSLIDGDFHRYRLGGCGIQYVGKLGIVQRVAGDANADAVEIIAETVQRGLQPRDVGPGPLHQGERRHRRLVPQADQLGTGTQHRIHLAHAGSLNMHVIGLRIGRPRHAQRQDRKKQCGGKSAKQGGIEQMGYRSGVRAPLRLRAVCG